MKRNRSFRRKVLVEIGRRHAAGASRPNPTRRLAVRNNPIVRSRLPLLAGALTLAGLSVLAQTPAPGAPPAGVPPQAPGSAPQGAAGRRGGGPGGQDNAGADFSARPPIQPRTPQEEAKSFLVPAGYRMELVAADPDINNPAVVE